MTSKSKKLLKVIDGLRAWNLAATISGSNQKSGIDIKEVLKSDHFQLGTIVKHGFPYQPLCMGFDPVQRILAVGTMNGCIKFTKLVHLMTREDNTTSLLPTIYTYFLI
ncbi:Syntaxin-binding protein 5-like protein [Echinococcus granulosus]|uniref:Syntaxin-binding protein 5-like protein n=1 Tax=Echinococcus granulosus TaxID=6210 RepID=W6UNH6_ECHGR|nr:Syntaxin-binding protein 5-like protein [Echinococcus granulosus]EUB63175.1 Syntaxin-binding protein 5-like protein [Echinococcus granulosus]